MAAMVWAGRVRKSDPLNERQLTVLRRISAGEDITTDPAAKTTARALHSRGLAVISTRGGWRADITDDGRFYLDHGHHPARPGGMKAACVPSGDVGLSARRRTEASELVDRLVSAGGVLIQDPDENEIAKWRKVVDFAKRHDMVPPGHHIEKFRRYDGGLMIALRKGSHPNAKPSRSAAERILVPDRIKDLHPLLSHLSDPASVLRVSVEQTPRALRIMHTVLVESESRGYEVGWTEDTTTGVEIRAGGLVLEVTLSEELVKRDVLPSSDELTGAKVYSWQRIRPEVRSVMSGKLYLELGFGHRRLARWADRQRWSVEDKLGEVFAEITERIQAHRDRIDAEARAKAHREREWAAAMDRARARFQHERRVTALTEQLRRWKRAARIRAYCAAVEAAQLAGDEDQLAAQAEWLTWCRSHADQIDPTLTGARAPEAVEPHPSELKAYLGRFSPYGP